MNTWQRIGQTPEHFTAAYHDATRGTVRAVALKYQPQLRTWWAFERTYKDRDIPPTADHEAIWHRLTPQEQAVCSLLFVPNGKEGAFLNLNGLRLSEALALMEVPFDTACPRDRQSPLW